MINYNAALPAENYPASKSSINVTDWIQGIKGNLSYLIRQAFRGGEVGFAYDPNDLSTMFQDAAGTTPVTAVGQPVGLMLDKSKGLAVGSELVDLSKWVARSNTTIEVTGNKVRISPIANGAFGADLNYTSLTISGKRYKILFNLVKGTATYVYAKFTKGQAAIYDAGTYSLVELSNGSAAAAVAITAGNVGDYVEFELSVVEVPGNHAYQTTSASRPVLRKNDVTGANYLEFDGVDDYLITNSFPSMGQATTIFAGSMANNTGTGAVVSRTVAGYIYQTKTQVTLQSVNNSISVPINGNTVITAKYAASGTGVSLKVNNTVTANQLTTDRGYNNINPVVIGAFSTAGAAPLSGHIYALIGIGKVVLDDESAAIEKEIAKRVGVTLNV